MINVQTANKVGLPALTQTSILARTFTIASFLSIMVALQSVALTTRWIKISQLNTVWIIPSI